MESSLPNMNHITGSHDLLWIVLDALRYDVATTEWEAGRTPHFKRLIPLGWEKRHTPGSFTFAAHQAFFAGFLPTPADPEAPRERLFAAQFAGSETTGPCTKTFTAATIPEGLRECGYHTVCIGGVGFFNKQTALSRVLTDLFNESHWCPEFGVTCKESPGHQFGHAAERLATLDSSQRLMLFINVSAFHQPNYFYLRDSGPDDLSSHSAALRAVDAALPILMAALAKRGRPVFHITCSDHGTAYGESGFTGHRVAVPEVWTVPYAHGIVDPAAWQTSTVPTAS